jgi:hypothetical protein
MYFYNFHENHPKKTVTQKAKIRPIWSPWLGGTNLDLSILTNASTSADVQAQHWKQNYRKAMLKALVYLYIISSQI